MKTITIDGVEYVKKDEVVTTNGVSVAPSEIQIVILQRGWIVIGRYSEVGDECVVRDAKVIRIWGTEKGLGQLALEGPQSKTKLDESGVVRAHKLSLIARLDVDVSKWNKHF